MGRPRLYHTPEEKAQANREKSKRHYDKQKKIVRAQRSVKYARENMGRPRLYHMPEEKAQANRVKSKRHYDKQKKVVRARRSVKYRENAQRSFEMLPRTCRESQTIPEVDCDPQNTNHVDYWCERAEHVASKFAGLASPSLFHYVDNLYELYLINRDLDTFRDAIIVVSCLQQSIRRAQDGVLQMAGVGKQWKRCEEISIQISDVVKALEDVLCWAMSGLKELIGCHSNKELLYHTLPCTV